MGLIIQKEKKNNGVWEKQTVYDKKQMVYDKSYFFVGGRFTFHLR